MRLMLLVPLAALAAPALALDPPVVARVLMLGREGDASLLFTNSDHDPACVPGTITASLRARRYSGPVTLKIIMPGGAACVAVGGFRWVNYRFALPDGVDVGEEAVLVMGESRYAFTAPDDRAPAVISVKHAQQASSLTESAQAGRATVPILANLETYNPIYATSGAGTNSDGKLQFSFQYQVFGDAARPGGDWKEGFRLAYTQTMFWDLGAKSKPFRDVNYSPELYYRAVFARPVLGAAASLRGGFQHLSNGRAGDASRSVNWLYIEPQGVWRTHGLIVTAAPRYLVYVGSDEDNPGIARQRGHQALALSVEQSDGFKLATQSRLNIGSGHGAIDADLSYPLLRLAGVPLYAVLQGFTGYGEDLRDYDRRQSRLRFGLGIAR